MTTLSDLIARLEAAPCGSADLDVAILQIINPDEAARGAIIVYTRSLDAAIKLVPKDCYLKELSEFPCFDKDGKTRWHAAVKAPKRASVFDRKRKKEIHTAAMVLSPALALCIAALKAREARR